MRNDIKWECPVCGEENIDNPDCTSFPICSGCDECFHWTTITDDYYDPYDEYQHKMSLL